MCNYLFNIVNQVILSYYQPNVTWNKISTTNPSIKKDLVTNDTRGYYNTSRATDSFRSMVTMLLSFGIHLKKIDLGSSVFLEKKNN